jgi:cation diffusion facilitator family transporter
MADPLIFSPSDAAELRCQHEGAFGSGNPLAERNTLRVVVLTAVMMVIEIAAGIMSDSMALLADGWHMGSHTVALGISAFAYVFARRHAQDARFAFGTWKVEVLGGYTSALLLAGVAALMVWESVTRLIHPAPILFDDAIAVAVVGLVVNLVCAWLLGHNHGGHGGHSHGGGHVHGHDHAHHDVHHDAHHHASHDHAHDHDSGSGGKGMDINLRSAYIHVLADASTSVFAIAALLGGKYWGANWLDPLMGIAGSVLVAVWAYGLLRDSGRVLLDAEMNTPVVRQIREVVAASPWQATISDLHVWRVSADAYACILSLSTRRDVTADEVRTALHKHGELRHVSVEITRTAGAAA